MPIKRVQSMEYAMEYASTKFLAYKNELIYKLNWRQLWPHTLRIYLVWQILPLAIHSQQIDYCRVSTRYSLWQRRVKLNLRDQTALVQYIPHMAKPVNCELPNKIAYSDNEVTCQAICVMKIFIPNANTFIYLSITQCALIFWLVSTLLFR